MTDLDIEVAEALEIIPEAAIAFVEQVLVDASFFIDWNDVLGSIGADGCALHLHLDDGAANSGEDEVDFPGGGIVFGRDNFDFGFHALLALVVLEHAGEGAVAGVVIDVGAGLEMCMAAKLLYGHTRVSGDLDVAYAGLDAGVG